MFPFHCNAPSLCVFFSDSLVHAFPSLPPAPQSCNDPAGPLRLEPKMQKLDALSTAVFFASKQYSARGEYGSVRVVLDAQQVLCATLVLSLVLRLHGNAPSRSVCCFRVHSHTAFTRFLWL